MSIRDLYFKVEDFVNENQANIVTEKNDERHWEDGVVAILKREHGGTSTALCMPQSVAFELLTEDEREVLIDAGFVSTRNSIYLNGETKDAFILLYENMRLALEAEDNESHQVRQLKDDNRRLRKELDMAREQNAVELAMADILRAVERRIKTRKPAKPMIIKPRTAGGNSLAGIPTLFLSDLHYDEVVDPAQVEYLNEYNPEIAQRRLRRVFQSAGNLMFNHMAGSYYEALVLALGGDMLSGVIHEELTRTNGGAIADALFELAEMIENGIRIYAAEFPEIIVPCVVGNHGRMEKKPTAKGKVTDNFDYILYRILERSCKDLANVTFKISTAADLQYTLYDTTFRLTHGDQFKGGNGVGGIWPALFRGDFRKRKRGIKAGIKGYDYLMMGHFHTYGDIQGVIVNGTLKGYDEWVYTMNFDFEVPQQALFLTHPDYGITFRMPVFAEEPEKHYSARGGSIITFNDRHGVVSSRQAA